jgi:hypothetical protein
MTVTVFFNRAAPHAWFFGWEAMREFLPDAIAEARALDDFEADGCEPALWQALLRLGWRYDDIAAIVAKPKRRPRVGYCNRLPIKI